MINFLRKLYETPLIVSMHASKLFKEFDGTFIIDCLNRKYFFG